MKFKHALIDSDPIIYSCGFSIEYVDTTMDIIRLKDNHTIQNAKWNIDSMIKKIVEATGAETKTLYLTGSGRSNFRFNVYQDYKSNRIGTRRPIYYRELREYMINVYDAIVTEGEEADDAVSIEQCRLNEFPIADNSSVICSIDKDFNNTPGWHYNYNRQETYYVSEVEALRTFYLQILTGDTSDGIPRIKKGWLKKKTEQALAKCETETEMYEVVKTEIIRLFMDQDADKEILWRGRLVWLRRKPNEMWEPNLTKSEVSIATKEEVERVCKEGIEKYKDTLKRLSER